MPPAVHPRHKDPRGHVAGRTKTRQAMACKGKPPSQLVLIPQRPGTRDEGAGDDEVRSKAGRSVIQGLAFRGIKVRCRRCLQGTMVDRRGEGHSIQMSRKATSRGPIAVWGSPGSSATHKTWTADRTLKMAAKPDTYYMPSQWTITVPLC